EIYDFIGKDEEAIDIYYDQYLRDTTVLDPIVKLANIFRKSREYSPAIHYYQKAVASDPENFYYHKQLAFCYDKINIPVGAIYSYKRAIMLNPHDAFLYIQLANIFNTERMFVDAIETCSQGLTIHKQNNQLLKIKAYAHYLNRDFDSSIVRFNKLLEVGDSSFFNLKYRGLTLFEKKEFVRAIEDLSSAYDIDRNDAELCFFLGSALGRSHGNDDGMDYLNKSLRILSPSHNELSNIYSEMANIFLNQEKYETSLEYLKLAYKADATPLLSFKLGQLYDYYLDNKRLAIDCYDGYLTMTNVPDSTQGTNNLTNSFIADPRVIENANERIRILKEKLFFESAKKE
ncbi:MAG: tetratricopeptide repeat protein, partial [Bacteroidales bacterium]|nr:tetratricopeptide repeat protein [Bacteroidales bacterium]